VNGRAVYWLLRDVTWPALRRHRSRAALTLVGVVVGVQLVMTIQLVNRATLASFEDTFSALAGKADLQITNGDVGVAETLVERVAADPAVASVSALVRGTLATPHGTLTVFGVDLLADQQLRDRQFPRRHVHLGDELRFVNATDSVALAIPWATAAGLARDGTFAATGPAGTSTLVVRGTLDPVGPATLFGGESRELGANHHQLGRVVDPQKEHDDGAGSAVAAGSSAVSEVQADQVLAAGEERGRHDGAGGDVPKGQLDVGEKLEEQTEENRRDGER